MTQSNELLPCPFCGFKPSIVTKEIAEVGCAPHTKTAARCYNCRITMPVEQWVIRADQPAPVDADVQEGLDMFDSGYEGTDPKAGTNHYEWGFDIVTAIKRALTATKHEGVTYHDTDYNSPLRPKRLEYTMCGKIYAVQENGERHMFMDVRGWGYLTGGGAKKLPYEEATVIQDKWANEVCNLWNDAQLSCSTGTQDKVEVIPNLEAAIKDLDEDGEIDRHNEEAIEAAARAYLKLQQLTKKD